MGGKGTYAAGNNVPYSYKTVDKIEGIKVLQPNNSSSSFSMPAEAHSSKGYIVLDKTGKFRQYREFNSEHLPVLEIGYHTEKGLSKSGEPVFHIHEYSKPGVDYRQKGRPMTKAEFEKYKKFFRGVDL